MDKVKKEIIRALKKDIDLSPAEYAEKCREADKTTANNGIKNTARGKTPVVNEELRHKRVQTNFYGTALNLLLNVCISLDNLAAEVEELNKKLNGKKKENEDIKEAKVENNE